MTLHDTLTQPWSLCFERDGTEDLAVIYDGDGDELLTSRHFWLPSADDEPIPPTLALVRLAAAAPTLLNALKGLMAHLHDLGREFAICDEIASSGYGKAANAAIAAAEGA